MKIKILSFHPFSLYENGGGSRILRRLYDGYEDRVISLAWIAHAQQLPTGSIAETVIRASPTLKSWMRWKLHQGAIWLQERYFYNHTVNQIRKAASQIPHEVIHVVDHGVYSSALCEHALQYNKQIWASFHDHFDVTGGSEITTKELWHQATRRLVISRELGIEYQRLFGEKSYEIITDGVDKNELSIPKSIKANRIIIVYFSGLLHIDYLPLFRVLADVLDYLTIEGKTFKLLLRGVQNVDILNNRLFEVDYQPFTINNFTLKEELRNVDILYLPIKFTDPKFYLFSLSTKMINYLGAPGSILYHGPINSAANSFLHKSKSAALCNTLINEDLIYALKYAIENMVILSANAKRIADASFSLTDIQCKFWGPNIIINEENNF